MSNVWQQQVPSTDLEINWNLNGNDLIVRVNKGPAMVARLVLRDAAKAMVPDELMNFSPFSPDFELRVGDLKEGLQRALQKAGLLAAAVSPSRRTDAARNEGATD
jgi:hypothetical protein